MRELSPLSSRDSEGFVAPRGRYGQLPHHFVGVKPTFLALSGATQTGPNTFWTKSALQYALHKYNDDSSHSPHICARHYATLVVWNTCPCCV